MESSEPSAAYSVVILESPFAKPDVRIRVFASEFHVHSPILKQHSAFFRRFLEYPEGATTSDEFKFTFVSVVDDDGEWGLEREAKVGTALLSIREFEPWSAQQRCYPC